MSEICGATGNLFGGGEGGRGVIEADLFPSFPLEDRVGKVGAVYHQVGPLNLLKQEV